MAVGASFGARLEHLRARKGTKETELAKAAILFYPKSAIFDRVATEIFCVTRGFGIPPNKQKTSRRPQWESERFFAFVGTQTLQVT